MSTVGIFDADIYKYIHVPFNLEAMKLAAYYKRKRDIVVMSPSFQPERYSTFIYRKDYDDEDFPKDLYKIPNIQYGGLAFTNSYIPLDENIERLRPDKSIYLSSQSSFCTNLRYQTAFDVMMGAEHFRLSLDQKNIWNKYSSQLSNLPKATTLFIHDTDVSNINGAFDLITDLVKEMNRSIASQKVGFKYPIQVSTEEEAAQWLALKPAAEYFTVSYSGILKDETYANFVQNDVSSNISRYFECNITDAAKDEDDLINNWLLKIYKQIIFSRQYHQRILLKYDKDFFINPSWCKVIDLFNKYAVSLFQIKRDKYVQIMKDDSLYSFVNSMNEKPTYKAYDYTKQDAREAFQLVRENNYELFKLFYECHQVELKGGEFIVK